MVQQLLTYFAVAAAMGFMGYKFYKQFLKKEAPCEGCAFAPKENHPK